MEAHSVDTLAQNDKHVEMLQRSKRCITRRNDLHELSNKAEQAFYELSCSEAGGRLDDHAHHSDSETRNTRET